MPCETIETDCPHTPPPGCSPGATFGPPKRARKIHPKPKIRDKFHPLRCPGPFTVERKNPGRMRGIYAGKSVTKSVTISVTISVTTSVTKSVTTSGAAVAATHLLINEENKAWAVYSLVAIPTYPLTHPSLLSCYFCEWLPVCSKCYFSYTVCPQCSRQPLLGCDFGPRVQSARLSEVQLPESGAL